jgi:hypothetical protein
VPPSNHRVGSRTGVELMVNRKIHITAENRTIVVQPVAMYLLLSRKSDPPGKHHQQKPLLLHRAFQIRYFTASFEGFGCRVILC